MSLSWPVVGVLPDDHDFRLVERTEVKGVEYQLCRRVDGGRLVLLPYEVGEDFEIGFVKLLLQNCLPSLFYLNIHIFAYYELSAESFREMMIIVGIYFIFVKVYLS